MSGENEERIYAEVKARNIDARGIFALLIRGLQMGTIHGTKIGNVIRIHINLQPQYFGTAYRIAEVRVNGNTVAYGTPSPTYG